MGTRRTAGCISGFQNSIRGTGSRRQFRRRPIAQVRRRGDKFWFVVIFVGRFGGRAGALERDAGAIAFLVLVADVAFVEGGGSRSAAKGSPAFIRRGVVVFKANRATQRRAVPTGTTRGFDGSGVRQLRTSGRGQQAVQREPAARALGPLVVARRRGGAGLLRRRG